jgi:5'-3' exonuclease
MGINNLNKFLRKNCIHVFKEIHISEYAYKKVAIDISLFLCKFKASCGDNWMSAFINLISCLRRNEIHCVFIFDNGCPDEKLGEREERRKQQDNMRKKISDLNKSLDVYKKTGVVDDLLNDLHEKASKDDVKRLLSQKKHFNVRLVEEKIKKMSNYILNISQSDFELAKELFRILNVPFYNAPLEAECACADLCKRGIVDAVLTEDTDVIAYGSNIFLSKIDTSNDTCVQIVYQDVLKSLKLNESEFLDLCIMFGCDYNKNINKVGIETSYKYIQKYRSIDEIAKQLSLDVSILNHERTRELFTKYEKLNIENIPFCGVPNFDLLESFISRHELYNIKNFNKLKECFVKNKQIILLFDDNEKQKENIVDEEDEIEYEIVIEDDDGNDRKSCDEDDGENNRKSCDEDVGENNRKSCVEDDDENNRKSCVEDDDGNNRKSCEEDVVENNGKSSVEDDDENNGKSSVEDDDEIEYEFVIEDDDE